ncbi:MAG: HAD-IC family P-type ATPase, partial [Christensenellaceae bacterium]|nr:HAD-IC family P-type ATPase [Christensenellaceae bacterium]
ASIKKAYGDPLDISRISESENLPGLGIKTVFDGDIVFAGNGALMQSIGIVVERKTVIGTSVYVAKCGKYLGEIVIADTLRDDSAVAIHGLKDAGVKNIVMLTGDVSEVANNVAAEIGIGQVYSELLPNDKVEKLEELLVKNNSNKTLAFVGDGINDAPALARADIGIAMGGLGSDAALEAADVVLMTDEPSKLIEAIEISKRTLNIARVNAIFAIGIKMLVLSLSAIGIVSMWIAVFADVGVCLLAVLNAFRALGIKKKARKKL